MAGYMYHPYLLRVIDRTDPGSTTAVRTYLVCRHLRVSIDYFCWFTDREHVHPQLNGGERNLLSSPRARLPPWA